MYILRTVNFIRRSGLIGHLLCLSRNFMPKVKTRRKRKPLPKFLLADGGDEFLEVERLEVGDVLEVA